MRMCPCAVVTRNIPSPSVPTKYRLSAMRNGLNGVISSGSCASAGRAIAARNAITTASRDIWCFNSVTVRAPADGDIRVAGRALSLPPLDDGLGALGHAELDDPRDEVEGEWLGVRELHRS